MDSENENLRELLRDTASVAITMLYDSHREDVLAEFTVPELEEVVKASAHLQGSMVEQVYRRAWDAALSQQAEPDQAQDERESLAERMRAAGMLTIDEMLSGAPLDRFIRHARVSDLESYGQWLDMKCREFLTMKAKRDLEKREDDDLYEWVIAHAAAFQEARINFNAALPAQTEQQPAQSGMPGASPKWAKYDTSCVVDYLRHETNFDADAIWEMLEFARRAALAAQGGE